MNKITPAIQLYSVRNSFVQAPAGTLQTLADMGYQAVEFAFQYGGFEPMALAELLQKLGLQVCGMHSKIQDWEDPDSQAYRYAEAFETPFVTSSMSEGDGWDKTARIIESAARVAAAQGFQFTYHNHGQEFAIFNGEFVLDYLYARTDPQLVKAQLDAHYITKSGQDPVAYIKKYAGRVMQVHLKDLGAGDNPHTEVGNGILDLRAIVAAASEAGAAWVICEQEFSQIGELESARTNLENLKKLELIG